MEDAYTFWTEHLPHEAIKIAQHHLGKALRAHQSAVYQNHHFLCIGDAPDFNLAAVAAKIRNDLDGIEWLFVTTDEGIKEYKGEDLLSFGAAPILPKKLTDGYHAVCACVIPRILEEGLLPSNAERRATNHPDTEGVIHVCAKLKHEGNDDDNAEWWMNTLAKENRFGDTNYGIVRIDMARLPAARVYQDMQSFSGVIVDRIDRIPANLITQSDALVVEKAPKNSFAVWRVKKDPESFAVTPGRGRPAHPQGCRGTPGGNLLRHAERQFLGLQRHEPPRTTRLSPSNKPLGSFTALFVLPNQSAPLPDVAVHVIQPPGVQAGSCRRAWSSGGTRPSCRCRRCSCRRN